MTTTTRVGAPRPSSRNRRSSRGHRTLWSAVALVAIGTAAALLTNRHDEDQPSPAHRAAATRRRALDFLRSPPDSLAATDEARALLDTLFSGEDAVANLHLVLDAVANNPTNPKDDPLWPEVIGRLSRQWGPPTLSTGLALLLTDNRPRARRALRSSLARFAASERASLMSFDQKQTFTNALIDDYNELDIVAQQEALVALDAMGHRDVVKLLTGDGVTLPSDLALHGEHERAIADSERLRPPP